MSDKDEYAEALIEADTRLSSLENCAEAFDARLRDLETKTIIATNTAQSAGDAARAAQNAATASRDTELRIRCLMIASGGDPQTMANAPDTVAAAKTMMAWLQEGDG